MKIAIAGLGAVGTHLAAHFAAAGMEVSSLVRQGPAGTLDVHAQLPGGHVRGGSIRVSANPKDLGKQDAVFVTVKTQQLESVAPKVAQLLGPDSVVVPPSSTIPYWYFHGLPGRAGTSVSWLDPTGALTASMPPAAVLGCAFWVGATLAQRGCVVQEGAVAGYPMGEPDGSRSDRLVRLSQAMQQAGLRAPVRTDIRSEIWMKLINSLCWNTIAVLTCAEMSQVRTKLPVVEIARRMMHEAEQVARWFGAVMPVPADKRIATALAATGHRMSSLQDMRAGRPLELDELVESFQRMRQLSGIATPLIDDMTGLAALRSATLALEQHQ